MNSVSDPATPPRAGRRGHKRGSRWFKGKFLIPFLAVATLLGGAAAVIPQLQEKASAANDGNDITWDIGNGNAGASRYSTMLEAVRQRASQGRFVLDRTHRTRPDATDDFFSVDISVQDEGTSTPNRIRVHIRASDLFVVGWLNQNENIYNRLDTKKRDEDPEPAPPLVDCAPNGGACLQASVHDTPFDGSYLSLERQVGDRANIPLSPNSVRQAVRDLSRSGSTNAQQARGMIVLIQAISEAARFRPIEELIRNTYTTEAATPSPAILELENSWDPMSEIAHRHVNNPNDEVINTLMRTHAGVLGDLGITNSRDVAVALLGISITVVIP
ncbi:ribosome-inactivating family protein [Streptomyces akebiae]|uniref:Ribosome-inactivating family protein n=1 Tax=Streptomyces akebiae TaxID=2865673 RepID=A0ABX8XRX4_9ACTN|nr:ribosome-inactivating family protein [Streptomyces akebiae]QYX78676.1 ribosome-inactivating family protein [Streptomyces akebiae]